MKDHWKQEVREKMKQKRAKVSASYRESASSQVCMRIRSLEAYREASHIALYFGIHGEIDLHPLWQHACLQGKSCHFPVLNQDLTLSFLPATPDTPFKKNHYGIPEPHVDPAQMTPIEKFDLVLIPLVAFDIRCRRLGMGAGCYDRTFKNKKTGMLYGVAYQFQRTDCYIEHQAWDIQLNAVITQRAVYWHSE